jgi:hypothetical protein
MTSASQHIAHIRPQGECEGDGMPGPSEEGSSRRERANGRETFLEEERLV